MTSLKKSILVLFSLMCVAHASTPFYSWSQVPAKGVEAKKESLTPTSASDIANEIKELFDADKAFSAAIYVRPGLTTENFVSHLSDSYPTIYKIMTNAKRKSVQRSYPVMEGGFSESLADTFPNIQSFNIDSEEAFTELKTAIKDTPKPFIGKVFEITIPIMKDERHFDLMVAKIEAVFETRTFGKHISAITGTAET
jgi:hypothetical protein